MEHQHNGWQSFFAFLGRIGLSLIFIIAGILKITHYPLMLATINQMGGQHAQLVLIVSIIFELGGGLFLLFGFLTRFGAILLLVFVIVGSFWFHSFWTFQGAAIVNQTYHLLKTLTILGGLLYVLAFGPGGWSIDHARRRSH